MLKLARIYASDEKENRHSLVVVEHIYMLSNTLLVLSINNTYIEGKEKQIKQFPVSIRRSLHFFARFTKHLYPVITVLFFYLLQWL